MSTLTAYLVAFAWTTVLVAGIGAYAAGDAARAEARGSYPGRRERMRAHGWFAIAYLCWFVDCVSLLALR